MTANRFPVPEIKDMPEDVRERVLAVQTKAGFVPNVFMALSQRPAEFRAFFAYHDALMEKNSGLTKAEREMIVVTTSGANQCQYCVIAHGAILRIRSKRPQIADEVAINYKKAALSARERAMLDLAMKVALESHAVSEADFQLASEAGFSNDEIWDICSIAAFFAMSNRLASAFGIPPNSEFFLMGRAPLLDSAKKSEMK
jgi:uncharacterized peroxidase-related enzyme